MTVRKSMIARFPNLDDLILKLKIRMYRDIKFEDRYRGFVTARMSMIVRTFARNVDFVGSKVSKVRNSSSVEYARKFVRVEGFEGSHISNVRTSANYSNTGCPKIGGSFICQHRDIISDQSTQLGSTE